ncbi:hypothetical protein LX36DRAFT_301692 [Colletotrichum falcatum]|nr:hypothetical protein LX36DRAFT_301692 [Colletotrichum falcatum]
MEQEAEKEAEKEETRSRSRSSSEAETGPASCSDSEALLPPRLARAWLPRAMVDEGEGGPMIRHVRCQAPPLGPDSKGRNQTAKHLCFFPRGKEKKKKKRRFPPQRFWSVNGSGQESRGPLGHGDHRPGMGKEKAEIVERRGGPCQTARQGSLEPISPCNASEHGTQDATAPDPLERYQDVAKQPRNDSRAEGGPESWGGREGKGSLSWPINYLAQADGGFSPPPVHNVHGSRRLASLVDLIAYSLGYWLVAFPRSYLTHIFPSSLDYLFRVSCSAHSQAGDVAEESGLPRGHHVSHPRGAKISQTTRDFLKGLLG